MACLKSATWYCNSVTLINLSMLVRGWCDLNFGG